MPIRKSLLSGAAAVALASTATAQTADQPDQQSQPAPPTEQDPALPEYEEEDSETIVVTGTKPRGSVVGDIPSENVLNSQDVRATGATDINELLEALAPQRKLRLPQLTTASSAPSARPAMWSFSTMRGAR